MASGEASVAEGRETPISCPSCGGEVHAILITTPPEKLNLLPCDCVVEPNFLFRDPLEVTV